jgi:hypothetical protein
MTRLLTVALVAAAVLGTGCKDEEDSAKGNPTNKAAEAEVQKNLKKIAKASSAYFSRPHMDKNGAKLLPRFPKSVDWTPAGKACTQEKKRFTSNVRTWDSLTWDVLNFRINGEHYAQYKITSEGTLADARTTILARIDPDCDSRVDVYTLTVAADAETIYTKVAAEIGTIQKH